MEKLKAGEMSHLSTFYGESLSWVYRRAGEHEVNSAPNHCPGWVSVTRPDLQVWNPVLASYSFTSKAVRAAPGPHVVKRFLVRSTDSQAAARHYCLIVVSSVPVIAGEIWNSSFSFHYFSNNHIPIVFRNPILLYKAEYFHNLSLFILSTITVLLLQEANGCLSLF